MNRWGLSLLGAVLLFGTSPSAQVSDLDAPIITNYGPEQYRANSQNWVAVQDRRGILYFGNAMGILEFDGQRWQLIPTPAATRALASGPDGTIYYGSVGDFGYLAASATGKVSAVSLRDAIPGTEPPFNDVWQVESSADGIYFMTRSRIFRPHGGRITCVAGQFASSQACVLDGTLFYADGEKGICLLEGDRVVPLPGLEGVHDGNRIALAPFGRHELLVARRTGDFRRIDLPALWHGTSQRYAPTRKSPGGTVQPFPSELDAFLKEDQAYLYKLLPLGPDSFAVGTAKWGSSRSIARARSSAPSTRPGA